MWWTAAAEIVTSGHSAQRKKLERERERRRRKQTRQRTQDKKNTKNTQRIVVSV